MRGGIDILGQIGTPGIDLGVLTPSFRVETHATGSVPDDIGARLSLVVARTAGHLPAEWGRLLTRLRSPRTIALMVGELFAGGVESFAPADAKKAGVVALSSTLQEVAPDITRFVEGVKDAQTLDDLEEEARTFARAIKAIGPEPAFKIMTMGQCESVSEVAEAFGAQATADAIGEDIVRSYMSTGGNSSGHAKARFGKGMKSQVTRNVRTTLEYLDATDAAEPVVDEAPNPSVLDVMKDMDMDGAVLPEKVPADSVLIATAETNVGGWFVHADAGVGTSARPKAYKVKGRIVALTASATRRDKGRALFIPRTLFSQLLLLPSGPPPPAGAPKTGDSIKLATRKPGEGLRPTGG